MGGVDTVHGTVGAGGVSVSTAGPGGGGLEAGYNSSGGYTSGGACSEEPLPNVWDAPGRVDGRGLPVVHRQMGLVGEPGEGEGEGKGEGDCLLCMYGAERSKPALKMKGVLGGGNGQAAARSMTFSVYVDTTQVSPMHAFVFCLTRADSLVAGGLVPPPPQATAAVTV